MNNKRNKADVFLCCELIPLEALQCYPAGLFLARTERKRPIVKIGPFIG